MYIIFGNYGDETLALIQWAFEHKLKNLTVVSIDTGFAAPHWPEHVTRSRTWAESLGMQTEHLTAKPDFATLIREQREFPSKKFQWCAGFLKGLTFNHWLDTHDPQGKATILLARRRASSKIQQDLPEFIDESEHFDERKIWHPLYQHTDAERDLLLKNAGLTPLHHRSLECDHVLTVMQMI